MLGKVTWFAKNIGIPWIPVTPTFPWLGPAGLLPLPSKWFVAVRRADRSRPGARPRRRRGSPARQQARRSDPHADPDDDRGPARPAPLAGAAPRSSADRRRPPCGDGTCRVSILRGRGPDLHVSVRGVPRVRVRVRPSARSGARAPRCRRRRAARRGEHRRQPGADPAARLGRRLARQVPGRLGHRRRSRRARRRRDGARAARPHRAETLYWRGAVLGDLGRHREALRAIEGALRVLTADDHWMLEDLYYEKAMILEALGLHEAAVATCEAGLAALPRLRRCSAPRSSRRSAPACAPRSRSCAAARPDLLLRSARASPHRRGRRARVDRAGGPRVARRGRARGRSGARRRVGPAGPIAAAVSARQARADRRPARPDPRLDPAELSRRHRRDDPLRPRLLRRRRHRVDRPPAARSSSRCRRSTRCSSSPRRRSQQRTPINYPDLGELLRLVEEQTGVERGAALTAAVGHSGAFRTLQAWLDEPLLDQIVLIDAMYGERGA